MLFLFLRSSSHAKSSTTHNDPMNGMHETSWEVERNRLEDFPMPTNLKKHKKASQTSINFHFTGKRKKSGQRTVYLPLTLSYPIGHLTALHLPLPELILIFTRILRIQLLLLAFFIRHSCAFLPYPGSLFIYDKHLRRHFNVIKINLWQFFIIKKMKKEFLREEEKFCTVEGDQTSWPQESSPQKRTWKEKRNINFCLLYDIVELNCRSMLSAWKQAFYKNKRRREKRAKAEENLLLVASEMSRCNNELNGRKASMISIDCVSFLAAICFGWLSADTHWSTEVLSHDGNLCAAFTMKSHQQNECWRRSAASEETSAK